MKYLITGITGFLGREIAEQLLKLDSTEIIYGLSRNEYLQWRTKIGWDKKGLNWKDKVQFVLGDVRDQDRIDRFFNLGIDTIIHSAALKHTDNAESNREEYLDVNVTGTRNLLKRLEHYHNFVYISSDKVCMPAGIYGASKLLAEKVTLNYGGKAIRLGNLIESHGNILEYIHLSDPQCTCRGMTRYYIHTDDAARFIIDKSTSLAGIYVPKMKSAKLGDIFDAKMIGNVSETRRFRDGEKMHEHSITKADNPVMESKDYYFIGAGEPWGFYGDKLALGFELSSDRNDKWWTKEEISQWTHWL